MTIYNAGNLINFLMVASSAGVYDGTTGTWNGAVPAATPVTLTALPTDAPTESAYGFTQDQASAIIAQLNAIIGLLQATNIAAPPST